MLVVAAHSRPVAAVGEPPNPDTAIDAFRTIEPWIRAWAIPEAPVVYPPTGAAEDEDALGLGALLASKDPVPGASVTLRLSGRVIGRGHAFGDDGTALWRAARLAWQEADAALPIPRDALRDRRAVETAQRITITLELAGELMPVVDPNFEALDWRATPGNAGIAIRRAARTDAVFPAELAHRGQPLGSAMLTLAHAIDPGISALDEFRGRDLAPYWFRAIALAQLEPGIAPAFLHRAGALVPLHDVSVAALHKHAALMAGYLLRQRWRGSEPHGMHGELLAITGRYRQMIAPPHEQALTALALARFARTAGVADLARERALENAVHLLASLATVTDQEDDPLVSPADAALIVLAGIEVQRAGTPLLEESLRAFNEARSVLLTAADDLERDPNLLGPVRRSIIVCALARLAEAQRDDHSNAAQHAEHIARVLTRRLYLENDAGSLIATMPWLLWASQSLADQPRNAGDDETAFVGLALLEAMATQVWSAQVVENGITAEDADLLGGIVFTRGTNPLPNWQLLRPLIAMASMLGDDRIISDQNYTAELTRLRRSLRFVIQLSVRDAEAHAYSEPDRALGGVRRSLWDHTISPDATALALIALCESLDALQRWNTINNR